MSELPQQPRPITVLSDHVIDQMQLVKLLSVPSVVKELVENVDAGATRIDIDIEDGGKKINPCS